MVRGTCNSFLRKSSLLAVSVFSVIYMAASISLVFHAYFTRDGNRKGSGNQLKNSVLSTRFKTLYVAENTSDVVVLLNKRSTRTEIKDNTVVNRTEVELKPERIRVAVLVPTTTRSLRNPKLENLSLFSIFIKSFFATKEDAYEYTVYVGIDEGDFLEQHQNNVREISEIIRVVIVKPGSFNSAVNDIARQAYRDNMTYFVRVNDDTMFVSKNWTSVGIRALHQLDPPNVGVVGPKCNQGNKHILTHDMVHRTHMDIFGYYYPHEFQYWYMDDWITRVYRPERSKKLSSWEVRHKMIHGTRYKVNHLTRKRLNGISKDKEVIQKYINENFKFRKVGTKNGSL